MTASRTAQLVWTKPSHSRWRPGRRCCAFGWVFSDEVHDVELYEDGNRAGT